MKAKTKWVYLDIRGPDSSCDCDPNPIPDNTARMTFIRLGDAEDGHPVDKYLHVDLHKDQLVRMSEGIIDILEWEMDYDR